MIDALPLSTLDSIARVLPSVCLRAIDLSVVSLRLPPSSGRTDALDSRLEQSPRALPAWRALEKLEASSPAGERAAAILWYARVASASQSRKSRAVYVRIAETFSPARRKKGRVDLTPKQFEAQAVTREKYYLAAVDAWRIVLPELPEGWATKQGKAIAKRLGCSPLTPGAILW